MRFTTSYRQIVEEMARACTDMLGDAAAIYCRERGLAGSATDSWPYEVCKAAGIEKGVEVPDEQQLRRYILETARKIVQKLSEPIEPPKEQGADLRGSSAPRPGNVPGAEEPRDIRQRPGDAGLEIPQASPGRSDGIGTTPSKCRVNATCESGDESTSG